MKGSAPKQVCQVTDPGEVGDPLRSKWRKISPSGRDNCSTKTTAAEELVHYAIDLGELEWFGFDMNQMDIQR